ncbi:hypothetical protein niasHS_010660 [Heterodera schachtii]|uniref:Uncharacterized protein n=1 Tax=Heterodera schachtii TaxID=97005 RepID=A0ABD2ITE2_HETSC
MIESLVERAWGCFFEPSDHKLVEKLKMPSREEEISRREQKQTEERSKKRQNFEWRRRSESEGSECARSRAMGPEAIDEAFRQMLAELDLNEEKQRELTAQSREWKWKMLVAQREKRTKTGHSDELRECENVLRQLNALNGRFPDAYELPLAVQRVEALAATLRTESFSFLQHFLRSNGLFPLVSLLNQCHCHGPSAEFLALPLLASIRALLNSTIGRQFVQQSAETFQSIAWALQFQSARCKVLSLEILSGLCVVADFGHRSVLRALTEAKTLLGERTRFQRLVDDLHREHGNSPKETNRVRVAIMSLVNALLKSGPTEHSLEFRLHLRHEFLMLGILQVVEQLRSASPEGDGSSLGDHLDLFEMMRQEDEQEMRSLSDSGSTSPIDFESPSGMAEVLTQRLDNTLALPHLISLFQHLLMVPSDEKHLPLWRLFDLVLQQLTLQSAMGGLASVGADPQFGQFPIRLDMDELLMRLKTQEDCEQLEGKLRETEQELEMERRRVVELENRLSDLQDGVSVASFSRVSEHSVSSSSPSDPCHSPPPFGPRSSALPPIRPPTNLAPPPPPPSALQLRSFGAFPSSSSLLCSSLSTTKKVPKPKFTLKTLNWKQIPTDKIKGTIWENIEEERLYKQIDMEEICEHFMAGRGAGDESAADGMGTMQRSRPLLRQLEQISVLEPRRAQNCTIMLSRLKLSHREIRQTVMSMDERAKLPKDMIEQMLKFVPSKAELQLIHDTLSHQGKSPSALALADRFLYEIGQIPRYEQRLKCLHTIRSFGDCLGVLRPTLNVVTRSSVQLNGSKRLRQFFALILAVGNLLNYGKRAGSAFGFSVFSLDEIPTVRSSSRPERNLMHFLVELAEQKFPELLRLKRELGAVSEAAKVNRVELEAELHQLDCSIRQLAEELNVHERMADKNSSNRSKKTEKSPTDEQTKEKQGQNGDRFVPVVRAFMETAKREMDELRGEHREMAQKFSECVRFFAASDPKKGVPSPDAFFGTFARCLNVFAECYGTIWAEREELERTKRQTLARTLNSRKGTAKHRRKERMLRSDRDFESLVNMLQSGELFSDHLGRLRTSVRAANGKKRKATAAGETPTNGAFSATVQSVMANG